MKPDFTQIFSTAPEDYPKLLKIWEMAVRATHSFLNEQHILQIRELIIQYHYFDHVQLFHIAHNGTIVGFMGLAYEKIEMLFVDPQYFKLGIGSTLLDRALLLGMTEVDINEQNEGALAFYQTRGFQEIARSEFDAEGNPFPILHLKVKVKVKVKVK